MSNFLNALYKINISASVLQLACGFFGKELPAFTIPNDMHQLVQLFAAINHLSFFTTYHIYPDEYQCVQCNKNYDHRSCLPRVVDLYLNRYLFFIISLLSHRMKYFRISS
jgi:hypothetical protein